MQAAHTRACGTRQASMHAQAGKTSKVTCRQRMRAAGHAAAMQSAKAERRLINGDQKLNVRRRRSKMAASELGQQLV